MAETKIAIKKYDIASPIKMARMATVLKQHVVKQELYSNIKGKNYAHVEGWQFAGGLLGLYPIIAYVKNFSSGAETKWFAKTEIIDIKNGKVVGRGFALCSSKESTKKSFDEYAILSMAQTRSIGKAYRNLIGWVMKMAGYEGTPSEEMHKVGETPVDPIAQAPQAKKGAAAKKAGKTYECHESGCEVSEAEYAFSMKMFGKPYCRDHQKGKRRKTIKNGK